VIHGTSTDEEDTDNPQIGARTMNSVPSAGRFLVSVMSQPSMTEIDWLPPGQLTLTVPCRTVEAGSTATATTPVLWPLVAPARRIHASDAEAVHWHPLTSLVLTDT
jgi:hypothetical protein